MKSIARILALSLAFRSASADFIIHDVKCTKNPGNVGHKADFNLAVHLTGAYGGYQVGLAAVEGSDPEIDDYEVVCAEWNNRLSVYDTDSKIELPLIHGTADDNGEIVYNLEVVNCEPTDPIFFYGVQHDYEGQCQVTPLGVHGDFVGFQATFELPNFSGSEDQDFDRIFEKFMLKSLMSNNEDGMYNENSEILCVSTDEIVDLHDFASIHESYSDWFDDGTAGSVYVHCMVASPSWEASMFQLSHIRKLFDRANGGYELEKNLEKMAKAAGRDPEMDPIKLQDSGMLYDSVTFGYLVAP
jgi:hypothetical protein